MQMILWHDVANGRKMRWAAPMQEREGVEAVDIAKEIRKTLCAADHEDYGHD